MPALQLDITIEQGATFQRAFTCTDAAGADLSGFSSFTARGKLRDNSGAEAAAFACTISGTNQVLAELTATQTAALSTALELAAQVNGFGSAAGTLGIDISGLSGSLSGSSDAQATLSTAIHLMGVAAGQCGVVGRLAEPVEILAQLRVMASDPLALTISVRDPLALRVTVH